MILKVILNLLIVLLKQKTELKLEFDFLFPSTAPRQLFKGADSDIAGKPEEVPLILCPGRFQCHTDKNSESRHELWADSGWNCLSFPGKYD